MLALQARGRSIQVTQMDWGIGDYVTPAQQAAYHARALLILNARGASPHRFEFLNGGEAFLGAGIFYRVPYGSAETLQTLRPVYVPKPAFFALHHTRQFLAGKRFAGSVRIPDADRQANRAYLYQDETGGGAAIVWRARGSERRYTVPPSWKEATVADTFGVPVPLGAELPIRPLPLFIRFAASPSLDELRKDLRTLKPADGTDRVALALHLSEPASTGAAKWTGSGKTTTKRWRGRLPSGGRIDQPFVCGLTEERFEFSLPSAGPVLLHRLWFLDAGAELHVSLNEGEEVTWDLSNPKMKGEGVRETSLVLTSCVQGRNTVRIRYEAPGNCAAYRVEPLAGSHVDLTSYGILSTGQTKGQLQAMRSVTGTGLAIGKTAYDRGLGTHAASLIEYPLTGAFKSLEVTVGVDAVTNGRGSVAFEVYVDGEMKASSGLMNGFSKPKMLKVEGLEKARRLLLVVKDGGDGNADDLADWVDGKLYLK
jgi:hypothetical protein